MKQRKNIIGHITASVLATSSLVAMPVSSEGINVLEEIVVIARKREESLQDIPESVTAFSAAKIEQAGIKQFGDFAAQTPNFTFDTTFSPNEVRITSRGIGSPQNGELPVAVVVDGIPVADPAFVNQQLVDIERIEVLRGPQGSLYGRNAMAGAINIVTRQASNETNGRLQVSYGSGSDLGVNGSVSGALSEDKLFYSLSGAVRDFDGQIENVFLGNKANFIEEYVLRGTLRLQASDNLDINFRANYIDSEAGSISVETKPIALFDDFSTSFLNNSVPVLTSRKMLELGLKADWTIGFATLTSITGYSDVDTFIYGDADFGPAICDSTPDFSCLLQDLPRNIEAFTQEFRLTSNNDDGLRWLIGAFYQDRDIVNDLQIRFEDGTGTGAQLNSGVNTADFLLRSLDDQTSESIAAFGQANIDLSDNLELTLGIRYDEDKRSITSDEAESFLTMVGARTEAVTEASQTFSSVQPKLSLSYDWTDDMQFYGTYAEGFRSGGYNSRAVPFQDETITSYELGFKGRFLDGQMTLNGSVFHIESDDTQIYFITFTPPSQNATNYNETTVDGFELEMQAKPSVALDINASIGISDGRISDFDGTSAFVGNRVGRAPIYEFNLGLQYSAPLMDNLDLRVRGDYERRGTVYWEETNTIQTAPRDIIDLRLFIENENWNAGFYVKNLLDEQYPVDGSIRTPEVNVRSMQSAPRSYGLEASYRF